MFPSFLPREPFTAFPTPYTLTVQTSILYLVTETKRVQPTMKVVFGELSSLERTS